MPEVLTPAAAPAMTSEDELCLLLARGQLTPEVRTRILQCLATPLQWPLVLERAYSHQVYPLLYRNLRDLGFPGVPETVQAELKGLFMANALRNQLLAEELARLLGLFSEAGIRVVPLKGVALAQSLYGDTAARVCADIDLLVPPASLAQAIELILAAGYRNEVSDPYFSKLVLRHGRHFNAVRDGRGVSFLVELHWELVQHSSTDADAVADLWRESLPGSFFGAPAFSLSPEWEFLYLSIHAVDHEWRSLKWLSDIHEVVSSGRISWARVAEKAERFEIDLPVRQTLAVSSHLLETPMPEQYSTVTLPAGVRLFPFMVAADDPKNAFAFRHLRLLPRLWDKVRYFSSIVFAPRPADLDFLRLPPALGFLYYVLRPPRLACKWSWRFLRAGLGRAHSILSS